MSVHHNGFEVNGGPSKGKLQTIKMFHSLVMYYLLKHLVLTIFTPQELEVRSSLPQLEIGIVDFHLNLSLISLENKS